MRGTSIAGARLPLQLSATALATKPPATGAHAASLQSCVLTSFASANPRRQEQLARLQSGGWRSCLVSVLLDKRQLVSPGTRQLVPPWRQLASSNTLSQEHSSQRTETPRALVIQRPAQPRRGAWAGLCFKQLLMRTHIQAYHMSCKVGQVDWRQALHPCSAHHVQQKLVELSINESEKMCCIWEGAGGAELKACPHLLQHRRFMDHTKRSAHACL